MKTLYRAEKVLMTCCSSLEQCLPTCGERKGAVAVILVALFLKEDTNIKQACWCLTFKPQADRLQNKWPSGVKCYNVSVFSALWLFQSLDFTLSGKLTKKPVTSCHSKY